MDPDCYVHNWMPYLDTYIVIVQIKFKDRFIINREKERKQTLIMLTTDINHAVNIA